MSVRDVEAIDYIGVNIPFRRVYVGIFDELDWQDELQHRDLLTRKIDRCLRHIRSGDLLSDYPEVRGFEIFIEYVSMHPMTNFSHEFWKTREAAIRLAGFGVHTRGVDVRPVLGITVETPVRKEVPEASTLRLENIEVLDAEPVAQLPDVAEVSFLPQRKNQPPRNRHHVPVLTRLSVRRAAGR
jgi:hypothetical protein